jgi:hypothetical protein
VTFFSALFLDLEFAIFAGVLAKNSSTLMMPTTTKGARGSMASNSGPPTSTISRMPMAPETLKAPSTEPRLIGGASWPIRDCAPGRR